MIRKMAGQGNLPGFRVGRDWRFDADTVDKMAKVSSVVQDAVSKVVAVGEAGLAEVEAARQQVLADQLRRATELVDQRTAEMTARLDALAQELRELKYESYPPPRAGRAAGWAAYPGHSPNGSS